MSEPVALDALADQMRAFGDIAYLVTTSADGRPHTVSVVVRLTDGSLRAPVGRSSATNVVDRGVATVLWPPADDPRYCLIVDTAGEVEGTPGVDAEVVLTPTRAVRHRQADAGADVPSCLPVGEG